MNCTCFHTDLQTRLDTPLDDLIVFRKRNERKCSPKPKKSVLNEGLLSHPTRRRTVKWHSTKSPIVRRSIRITAFFC